MDTKWIEDFLALAEARSFSRAAHLRHISQPAFSRRIQALEGWLGFDLINRTSYPPRLTPAGENFYPQARELMDRVGLLRSSEGGQPADSQAVVRMAMPHTLSLSFVPQWLAGLAPVLGVFPTQLRVGSVLDVVLTLVEGGCDLLICYHHPKQPLQLDPERYDVLTLGADRLAPYALSDGDGRPLHTLPGKSEEPVPYLAFSSNAYLGRMAEIAISNGPARVHLRRVCETDLAESLRQMVLAGHGLAFLPDALARQDVESGRLIRLPGGWDVSMDIRVYRERPTLARPAPRRAGQLWQLLESPDGPLQSAAAHSTVSPPAQKRRHPKRQTQKEIT